VDAERFKPDGGKRESFLLSVGQLNRWKGQDFLIRSLSYVPAEMRPALHLVYNKSAEGYKRYIDQKAGDLGIRVKHFQNIQESELVEMYRRAMFLVYSPIMEPFGFAPLEAMACETPVVAVKEGGVRETISNEENGLLVSRNPREFAQAVIRLLLSEDLRERLGRKGRQCVQQLWSWADSAERLEAFMLRLRDGERSLAHRY
jgi:glycosyltransferase involved in cell wall biosynthesis